MEVRERFVSKKFWVAELLAGELNTDDESVILSTPRASARRINVIGVVVNREDLPVSSALLDDGTGQIPIRSFDRPINHPVGSVIQVIGRPRSYQGKIYIAAEHVAKIDPLWAEFRKKELGKVVEPAIVEVPADENNTERILRFIKELDKGNGADIDEVIALSAITNAEAIIGQMLLQGDIFEVRAGKVKTL